MYKTNYSALFAIVMILLIVPFIPAMVEKQFDQDNSITSIRTTHAATQTMQISDYTSRGYAGKYGMASLQTEKKPAILGVSVTNSSGALPYQAQEVNRSNSVLNLNPGTSVTVWVDFLNTGQATWYNTGDHFIALNVTNPTGRHSAFQHEYWNEYYRAARLLQDEVRPGQTGRFVFALQAPEETGTYLEEFHLVAENLTFIDGGYTSFHIGVGEKINRPPDYQATEVSRTKGGTIDTNPGTAFTFELKFKNTGLRTWYNSGEHFIAMNVYDPIGRHSAFQHEFWNEYYYRPARLLESRIYPGETGTFRFALQAPNIEGYYNEKFALVAENLTWVDNSVVNLPIKVGNPPNSLSASSESPNIRIGLYKTDQPIIITANGKYQVINMNNNSSVPKNMDTEISINPSDDAYWRIGGSSIDTILEIKNFENHPLWNTKLNDNKFRGTIEIRYSQETRETWVINELPIEYYLRGLAEVSNEQPEEYLKSLIIAARSYALWHEINGGKHPDNYYDINATTDQVYRGYGFELRSIDPLQAVQKTSGQVITHPQALSENNPDGIAVATYSSGTDGRTRDWTEIWSGDGWPWLVSVDDPLGVISNWNTLEANHMVGMSATGARAYASEENKTYDWILKHYYTGVSIEKIY